MSASSSGQRRPAVAVLLPAHRARAWQMQAARSLLAWRQADVQLHYVAAGTLHETEWLRLMVTTPALSEVSAPSPVPGPVPGPVGQAWDVVVDLCGGEAATAWEGLARHGVWRIRDAQGLALADAFCCHTAICSGLGVELFLVGEGDRILHRLRFHAEPDYAASLPGLYVHTAWLVRRGLRALRCDGRPCAGVPFRPRPIPSRRQRAWQRRAGRLRSCLRRLSARWLSENWMIGIVEAPIHSLLSLSVPPKVRWLGRRAHRHYRADPFGAPGQPPRLYCEEYEYRRGMGRIVVLELDGRDRVTRRSEAPLPSRGHASYPFLFEHAGRLYCIPETAAQGRCLLHEIGGDGEWRFVATLLQDVAAADATLFHWDGLFWLAYTDVALGEFDNLCLSWAPELAGPWRPHVANPVKIDHRSSRPGGTPFVHCGSLYRPAQDCGAGYGRAVVMNRVTECTPQHYREEPVRRLSPDPHGRNPHGLHTVSAWGKRTLVDGKRRQLNLLELQRKFVQRLCGKTLSAVAPAPAPRCGKGAR